jgi:hypothetical protein
VATDAKQSGEDVPKIGAPSPAPLSPPSEDRPIRRQPNLTTLHRRARAALTQALSPGEEPRLVIPGLGSTALIATDARVFVFKTGAHAGLPFSSRLKEFEYESVMRIDLRNAGDIDVVVIHAPLKIASCSSYWVDSRDDPWRARNAIPVGRASSSVERAVAELTRLLSEFRGRSAMRPSADAGSVVERITEIEKGSVLAGVPPSDEAESRPSPGPTSEDCPRCGNKLRVGWQFCPRCGAPAKSGRRRTTQQRRRRSP